MPKTKDFFKYPDKIVSAIQQAESYTSGEIKVHIESKNSSDTLSRAKEVFHQLDMHKLPQKNGVLIYIAVESKQICIWGDKHIHEAVGSGFWDEIILKMIDLFKAGKYDEGTVEAILKTGQKLRQFFPFNPDKPNNDLSDEISYGE